MSDFARLIGAEITDTMPTLGGAYIHLQKNGEQWTMWIPDAAKFQTVPDNEKREVMPDAD